MWYYFYCTGENIIPEIKVTYNGTELEDLSQSGFVVIVDLSGEKNYTEINEYVLLKQPNK